MDVYAEDDLNDSVMRPLEMLSRLDQVNKGQRERDIFQVALHLPS